MNEVILAAIFAGVGSIITIIGKVIVDIIRAKKEPDEADEALKNQLNDEKAKNDAAIEAFTDFGKQITASVEQIKTDVANIKEDVMSFKEEVTKKFDEVNAKMDSYRNETREINKSSLRHEITQIYFANYEAKTLDMRTKEDLSSLYEAYSSIGGNSFAHDLFVEMQSWEIKR